ncbi:MULTISPECIES: isoprenylcysteine carboxylmethyltransferase family protein [unclassified Streptomyces]|uniref:methyltransferase family protein n=1 Tax=unclassified Streptomyces TaxID=2593676 RepID=UPI00332CC927
MNSLRPALVALTGVCFLVFAAAWLLGAAYFGIRHHGGVRDWLRASRASASRRLLLIAGVALFLVVVRHTRGFWEHLQFWRPELAVLGALLALVSTALLLWARWVLGTMWDSVPSLRQNHELRTDGPYRLVRHPIYTGVLGLVTGSMLAGGFGVWTAFLAAAIPWLLRRVRAEDALMAGEFGAAYDAYRSRVPALIPRLRPGRPHPRGAGGGGRS